MTTAAEIEAQAAAWLVKRDGRALTDAEQGDFDSWIAADPRARAAYIRLESAWKQADALRRLRPLEGDVDADLLARPPFAPVPIDEYPASEETRAAAAEVVADIAPTRSRWWGWLVGLAVAATLAALGIGALLWYSDHQAQWQTYSTDFGGLSKIVLEDGSVINLNTTSQIRVRITPKLRRIVLDRGEALFKVAHDPTRPFHVEAAGTTVRAVGTEFSVRVREPSGAHNELKDLEVLVREGRVAIDPQSPPPQREAAASSAAGSATVSAGESVVINGARALEVQRLAEADVERKLSWTEGRLWFERQTLKDVVAEFNRYNRRQMVIADPAIENLLIGGGFEATDPESFRTALESTLGVRAVPAEAIGGGSDEVVRLVGTEKNAQ